MENLKNYTDEELLAMVDAHDIRIRKLTPRECFRLMGVSEANIDKIQAAGVSKTQQYKMAGNSIVVHNLWHIFEEMFYHEGEHRGRQLSLFPLD